MNDFRRLYPYIRPHRWALAFSLLLLFLVGVFESTTTTLSIPLFDKVLVSVRTSAVSSAQELGLVEKYVSFILSLLPGSVVTRLSLALLFLTVLKGICLYYSNYSMSRVGQSVVMDVRNDLFRHVLSQSMSFFSLNSTGKLMSRMTGDVEQVQEAVSTVLAELFREAILLISLIILIFCIDWKLALFSYCSPCAWPHSGHGEKDSSG